MKFRQVAASFTLSAVLALCGDFWPSGTGHGVLAAEDGDYGGNSQQRLDELRGWLNKRHQERGESPPSPSRPDYQPAPAPDIASDYREPRRHAYRHGSGRVHHARPAKRHRYSGHHGKYRSARRHAHAGHKSHDRHRAASRRWAGTPTRAHQGRGPKVKHAAQSSHRHVTRASHGHKAKVRHAASSSRGQAGKTRTARRYHQNHAGTTRKAVRASHRHTAKSSAKVRKTASRTARHHGRRRG